MTAMTTSISEVLETMCFMSLNLPADKTCDDFFKEASGKVFGCEIGFSGKVNGKMQIFMPDRLIRTVTENFMGQDPDSIEESLLEGTLKEVINMAAGNTFSIYDSNEVFNLSIPEMIEGSAPVKTGGEELSLYIETMDGNMAAIMTYEA